MITLTIFKSNSVALTIFTVLYSHHCRSQSLFWSCKLNLKPLILILDLTFWNKRQVLRTLRRVRKAAEAMGWGFGISGLVLTWLCLCSPLGTWSHGNAEVLVVEIGSWKAWEHSDRRLHNKLCVGVAHASLSLLFTKLESQQETEPTQIKITLRD